MSILSILRGLLWDGNLIHGLWFLLASIVGLLITYGLSKILNIRIVFIISIIFLIIGTVKSTYSTAVEQLTGITLPDYLGFRNGLFYAFPYFTLGMAVAKTDNLKKIKINRLLIGFVISLLLLIAETFLFVIVFKTTTTILWLSVLPYAFFFFLIVLKKDIYINKNISIALRNSSTLMYVSQYLFIPLFNKITNGLLLFLLVTMATFVFSLIIISLSKLKYLKWLHYLY